MRLAWLAGNDDPPHLVPTGELGNFRGRPIRGRLDWCGSRRRYTGMQCCVRIFFAT